MLGWLRRRRTAKEARAALVEADAADLIGQFGDQAYFVARERDRDERIGRILDAGRPPRHWSAVRSRIAALTGKEIGVDTATRYLRNS